MECADRNLTSLLSNIESETQVLDYSKNNLQMLGDGAFERVNLINLQKLYVSECGIAAVHDAAFRGLANLIELDLSANALTTVPVRSFSDVPLLMKLIVSGNPIRGLQSGSFAPLKYLATLDLSQCQVDDIDENAFEGLRKLEWLKLEGNQLKTIKRPRGLPPVAGGLSLHRNPWKCDCNLRTFHAWLADSAAASTRLVAEPTCAEPANYRGSAVSALRVEDLACAPYVVPSSLFVEINEGKNISFVCQVNAVPEAHISWEFEGNPVSGNSSFVYPFYKYYAEEATTEQVSELFVFEAKKENNGTYRCTAQNAAGKSTSNYTLNVIGAQNERPESEMRSYFYGLVSAVATLSLIAAVSSMVISCLIYVGGGKRRKPAAKTGDERKSGVAYEIVKQQAPTAKEATDGSKSDTNPDLIINTDGNGAKDDRRHCERLLLLPGEIKQTYLALADDARFGTAVYEGAAAVGPAVNLMPATPAGTIKLYLAPNPMEKFHNLYVNPFEGYVDAIEQNCWTFQLSEEDGLSQRRRHVLIDCCNQPVCQKQSISNACEFVNLRHNLEGYPYPSKLKLKSPDASVQPEEEKEATKTPILSPPDPFKTSIASFETKNHQ